MVRTKRKAVSDSIVARSLPVLASDSSHEETSTSKNQGLDKSQNRRLRSSSSESTQRHVSHPPEDLDWRVNQLRLSRSTAFSEDNLIKVQPTISPVRRHRGGTTQQVENFLHKETQAPGLSVESKHSESSQRSVPPILEAPVDISLPDLPPAASKVSAGPSQEQLSSSDPARLNSITSPAHSGLSQTPEDNMVGAKETESFPPYGQAGDESNANDGASKTVGHPLSEKANEKADLATDAQETEPAGIASLGKSTLSDTPVTRLQATSEGESALPNGGVTPNVTSAGLASTIPTDLGTNPATTGPDVVGSAGLPGVNLAIPIDLAAAANVKRRSKLLRKARYYAIPKPALTLLLGRGPANTIHPVLKTMAYPETALDNLTSSVPGGAEAPGLPAPAQLPELQHLSPRPVPGIDGAVERMMNTESINLREFVV